MIQTDWYCVKVSRPPVCSKMALRWFLIFHLWEQEWGKQPNYCILRGQGLLWDVCSLPTSPKLTTKLTGPVLWNCWSFQTRVLPHFHFTMGSGTKVHFFILNIFSMCWIWGGIEPCVLIPDPVSLFKGRTRARETVPEQETSTLSTSPCMWTSRKRAQDLLRKPCLQSKGPTSFWLTETEHL